MITLRPHGRLGNQLFFFILGMYLHELLGMEFLPQKLNQ